jgi:pantoate--beta-alanine ligase
MVADLDMAVSIARCPTVRERDGLAMSSRNAYLSPDERSQALSISRALAAAAEAVRAGERSAASIEAAARASISAQPLVKEVQYVDVVDPVTLRRIDVIDREARILVAAVVGGTRLIDNGPLIPG